MTTVIAVDPGGYTGTSAGSLAIRTAAGVSVIRFIRKSKRQIIKAVVREVSLSKLNGPVFGVKEDTGARPGEGTNSIFSNGKSHGFAEDLFEFNFIEYMLVIPQTWQLEFALGGPFATTTERKNAHRAKANELFGAKFLLDECDSVLLAEYGWRKVHNILTGGKDGRERIMPEVQRTEDGRRIWNVLRKGIR